VFPHIPSQLPLFFRSPRNITAVGFGIAAAAGITGYLLTRKRITPAERERARRDYLARNGRITDGSITETQWLVPNPAESEPTVYIPSMLLYRYRIAGVTYECAQDVSYLPEHVRHVRVDLPIQVRFDPRNPGNSIVVAEDWSGLRLGAPMTSPAPSPLLSPAPTAQEEQQQAAQPEPKAAAQSDPQPASPPEQSTPEHSHA
jgi:hypothetical protein